MKTRRTKGVTLVGLGLSIVLHPGVVGAVTAVTACDQIWSGTGYLTADLICPPGSTVGIDFKGKLELRGFTLGAGLACIPRPTAQSQTGGACTIKGPGTIDGFVSAHGNVRMSDTIVDGSVESYGFYSGSVKLRDSTVTNSPTAGVQTQSGRISLFRSSVSGNGGSGIFGGFRAGVRVVQSDVSGNGGNGINTDYPTKLRVKDSTVNDNDGAGLAPGWNTTVSGCTITGNGGPGIADPGLDARVIVKKSTIANNDLNP